MRSPIYLLAVAASFALSCSADLSVPSSDSGTDRLSTVAAEAISESVVLAEFDFSYDAATGEHHLEVRDPTQAEYVSPDGTIRQALGFCNDFGINIGSSGAFTLNTLAGSVGTTVAECVPPSGITDWGTLFYNEGGAFCATIRAANQSGATIDNVSAEITEITAGYEGYEYIDTPEGAAPCCGTGADTSGFSGQNVPSDLSGGVFLHGDLADGVSGDRRWTFRNAGGSFAFSGRLVGSVAEVENGRDDDCDGRIDNAVYLYGAGEACIEDIDCQSEFCQPTTDTCAAPCDPGYFGPSCLECPGGAADPCNGNGDCSDNAAGDGTCACDSGWAGGSCSVECAGGAATPCNDNGTCTEGSAGDGTCVCDPGFDGSACDTLDAACGGSGSFETLTWPPASLDYSGTTVSLSDDQVSGSIPLGFTTEFFGASITDVRISSNGFVYMGATGDSSNGCCSGREIPASDSVDGIVALAWGDLYPPGGQNVRYRTQGTAPLREFVVSFDGVPDCCTSSLTAANAVRGQIIFREASSVIDVVCEDCVGDGRIFTVGAESLDGTEAVLVQRSTAAIRDTHYRVTAGAASTGAGACSGGCLEGFYGATCDIECPGGSANPCNGNGTCDSGTSGGGLCTCDPGFFGTACAGECPGGAADECSGNGTCADGAGGSGLCTCDPFYTGADCSIEEPECVSGFFGADCATECPGGALDQCSGNGICADGRLGTGACECDNGFAGADCSEFDSTCSAAGVNPIAWPGALDYTGTALSLSDDSVSSALPLGFTTTFFGEAVTDVRVSSNGFVYMGATGTTTSGCCSGGLIPSTSDPDGIVALCWTDLYPPGNSGSVTYRTQGTAPNREFIVSFEDTPECCSSSPTPTNSVTGQVVIREGDVPVEIRNANCTGDGRTFTVGAENADGTEGYQAYRQTTRITDTAVEIASGGAADCVDGCVPGFWGADCSTECPGGSATPCSDNGTCSSGLSGTGVCTCDPGYFGADCASECPGGAATPCNGNGTCASGATGDGTCTCNAAFTGADCTEVVPECADGFFGADCLSECPGGTGAAQCSGNGICADGRIGTGACTCDAGYVGADCALLDPTCPVGSGEADWPGLYPMTGTTVPGLSDDNVSGSIPFGFDFEHYGNTYNFGRVSSNGFMYFGNDGGTGSWYSSIPSTSQPNNMVSFYGYDLYPPGGQRVRYRTEGVAGSRMFILSWDDVNRCCSSGTTVGNVVTVQMVLHEGGGIEILVEEAISGTVYIGVENLTGTEGENFYTGSGTSLATPIAYNFNMGSVREDGATCFAGCVEGYYGAGCTNVCPGGADDICSGNGTCASGTAGAGTCTCDSGFVGADCSTVLVPCADGIWGIACDNTCPGGAGAAQCSGNGECSDGPLGDGTCTCDAGFAGADCSEVATGPGCAAMGQESLTWPGVLDYSGTAVTGLSDDSVSPVIPFGFTHHFFGTAQTSGRVSSNGYMYVGAGTDQGCCSGDPIPNASTPNGMAALAWSDLYPPGNANHVRWRVDGAAPNREFVLSFEDVPDCCSSSPTAANSTSGQIIVHEDSSAIDIYCENCTGDGRNYTVGVEDSTASTGVQLHYGTGVVTNTAWRVFTGACP